MADRDRINGLLDQRKTVWKIQGCVDSMAEYRKNYIDPLVSALGDDEKKIMDFLSECSVEDLLYMTEVFEILREKFPEGNMVKFLEQMEERAGIRRKD